MRSIPCHPTTAPDPKGTPVAALTGHWNQRSRDRGTLGRERFRFPELQRAEQAGGQRDDCPDEAEGALHGDAYYPEGQQEQPD